MGVRYVGKEIEDTLIMNAMHTIELGIRMNSAMIILLLGMMVLFI